MSSGHLLADEIAALRIELLNQWLYAHSDHCGCLAAPWPPDKKCNWPMPAIISNQVAPNKITELLETAAAL